MKATTTVATGLMAVGMASGAVQAIVLPDGKGFQAYAQHANHPLPRAVDQAGAGIKIPIYRQSKRDLNDPEQTLAFARSQLDYVLAKWGKGEEAKAKRAELQRRQLIGLSDYGQDNFYFGQVSVGTPYQNFNVILDTGSADFWLADTSCTNSQCDGVNLFNPSDSSTYKGTNDPFEITYGTGAVEGTLSADTVSLAGYVVDQQTFAVVDKLESNSLQAPTSGIMGMGFQALAESGATPFWQVLVEQNKLQTNAFTFQLARNVDSSNANGINAGGVFTLGEIDSNQYSGSINYVDLTGQEGYWTVPLQSMTINGQSATGSFSSSDYPVAAIDTGTTLIVAPPYVANTIYNQINGAQSLGSSSSSSTGTSGAFAIPCNSNVDVTITFGGTSYSINSDDMKAGALDTSGQYCLGGVLGTSLGSGAPDYIVGDVFLKNVFSVYRYSPAAVGFASLKGSSAQTLATTSGAVGSVGSATATGGGSVQTSFASVASVSTDASDSTIAAGSGLPSPSAVATTASAISASLTPGSSSGGSSSSSSSSGAASSTVTKLVSFGAMALAMVAGVAVAL